MIVKEMRIGKSIVRIDDSSVRYTTPEEIKGVLDRIADIVVADLNKSAKEEIKNAN